MLLILALACTPNDIDKTVDTGDVPLDSSGWTPMGCEPEGIG